MVTQTLQMNAFLAILQQVKIHGPQKIIFLHVPQVFAVQEIVYQVIVVKDLIVHQIIALELLPHAKILQRELVVMPKMDVPGYIRDTVLELTIVLI